MENSIIGELIAAFFSRKLRASWAWAIYRLFMWDPIRERNNRDCLVVGSGSFRFEP